MSRVGDNRESQTSPRAKRKVEGFADYSMVRIVVDSVICLCALFFVVVNLPVEIVEKKFIVARSFHVERSSCDIGFLSKVSLHIIYTVGTHENNPSYY
jgi:hypothetical protein